MFFHGIIPPFYRELFIFLIRLLQIPADRSAGIRRSRKISFRRQHRTKASGIFDGVVSAIAPANRSLRFLVLYKLRDTVLALVLLGRHVHDLLEDLDEIAL